MRLRGSVIGALNLFRADTGKLEDADVQAAQALADIATIAILQHRVGLEAHVLNTQLNEALSSRILIEQAKGVIAERAGINTDEAFTRLRQHARSNNLRLADVAADVASGTLAVDAFGGARAQHGDGKHHNE
jgi:GAF domain-containing protein